jgi:zinc transport system substrate-binding protein
VEPLAGLVERVAPDLTDVTVLIPAGASPVSYEPSVSRVRAASAADLFVSVGHPAFAWEETWLAGLLGSGSARLISSSDGCDLIPDDPHVWLSVECARGTAQRVAAAVIQDLPHFADSVGASLERLLDEMDARIQEADSALAPRVGGSFVVLHPAWGYVAREYELRQIAVLDHGSGDAGPAELAEIVRVARASGLRNVIVQPQFATEPAVLVAAELGGTTVLLDPLARDWATSYRRTVQVLSQEVRP